MAFAASPRPRCVGKPDAIGFFQAACDNASDCSRYHIAKCIARAENGQHIGAGFQIWIKSSPPTCKSTTDLVGRRSEGSANGQVRILSGGVSRHWAETEQPRSPMTAGLYFHNYFICLLYNNSYLSLTLSQNSTACSNQPSATVPFARPAPCPIPLYSSTLYGTPTSSRA